MLLTWRTCRIMTAGRYAVDSKFLGLRVEGWGFMFKLGLITRFNFCHIPIFKKDIIENRECRNRDMVKVKTCFCIKTMQYNPQPSTCLFWKKLLYSGLFHMRKKQKLLQEHTMFCENCEFLKHLLQGIFRMYIFRGFLCHVILRNIEYL